LFRQPPDAYGSPALRRRLENRDKINRELIEVRTGSYLDEDDMCISRTSSRHATSP
jgi:hypothetical protein